jgi:poly-beta-1,6 N-acetyl-D-glucosamine synthase
VLVALVALAVSAGLLLQGWANNQIGRASTKESSDAGSAAPRTAAVLYADHGQLLSRALPAKTVALTFDDGPDPRWTPRVLAVLQREHVPATFFDVGSRVATHPALVRRELALGNDVGSHTFTHAELSNLPGWRQSLELSMSQLALAGATGRASVLMRPPYSSTPLGLSTHDLPAVHRAADAGYLVVLADRDSQDWTRPGWVRIVANAMPTHNNGAIVMMHDGGGNRAQTVEALPHLIELLKARGYRFTTVTGGLGLRPGAAQQRVAPIERLQGLALLWALRLSAWLAAIVTWFVAPLSVLVLLWTLLMLVLARRYNRVRPVLPLSYFPPVSVVVPAYNEAVGIAAAVRSLAASDYPDFEIVVVDDGSTDGTSDIVQQLDIPGVRVVRQHNAGKATALNTGIEAARYDVLVLVDGDTVFQADTLRAIVQQMRDPGIGAVAGNTKVGNRRGLLGRWQHLEYVVGFNLERRMFDLLGCITTVPGAVGAFRRDALAAVGGVSTDTLAEDTDLTMAILRAGYRVVFEPRAVAWTEAPGNFQDLWRQRYRWCYGTMQSVWKHRHAALERGPARRLGLIGLPTMFAFRVTFPLVAPALDLFALFGIVFIDPLGIGSLWVGYALLQTFIAAYALRMDRESVRPVWAVPLQQFAYRQLMYLVVIQSVISATAGVRLRWHKLHRSGAAVDAVGHLVVPAQSTDHARVGADSGRE